MKRISFAEQRILVNVAKIVFLLVILTSVFIWCVKAAYLDVLKGVWSNPEIIKGAIWLSIGIVSAWLFLKARDRLDEFTNNAFFELRGAIIGNKAEKETFIKLRELLDARWYTIYPNFKIPGEKFDCDVVIVGPKGIILIEVKDISGKYDFVYENTFKHDIHFGNACIDTLREYRSPSRELLRHCARFENWLHRSGLEGLSIKKALILAGGRARVGRIENPPFYIVNDLVNLPGFFENAYDDHRFTPDFCLQISKFFDSNNSAMKR